jgi:hypothetical protein
MLTMLTQELLQRDGDERSLRAAKLHGNEAYQSTGATNALLSGVTVMAYRL